jgi:hypothetical protein
MTQGRAQVKVSLVNGVIPIVILVLLTSVVPFACRKDTSSPEPVEPDKPAPPDLADCTRLEITFLPSLVDEVFVLRETMLLFTDAELHRIRSSEVFAVEQPRLVERFVEQLMQASYWGPRHHQLEGRVECMLFVTGGARDLLPSRSRERGTRWWTA